MDVGSLTLDPNAWPKKPLSPPVPPPAPEVQGAGPEKPSGSADSVYHFADQQPPEPEAGHHGSVRVARARPTHDLSRSWKHAASGGCRDVHTLVPGCPKELNIP